MSPLEELRRGLAAGEADPVSVARESLARANGSASRNTYLRFDVSGAALLRDAHALAAEGGQVGGRALYGVPVSLKDCFDLTGTVSTCGSGYYERTRGVAGRDSAVAMRLRAAGCLITGKTHLHPLAYGITGENPEFGDCLQPRDGRLLTGGSSSGAAASVQEGSALAAIGTDTGGSIRVPAALCGLAGWRCAKSMTDVGGGWPGGWEGGTHLSESFDTIGLLFRDPRDAPALVGGIFGIETEALAGRCRVGCVAGPFLEDCEPEVMDAYRMWQEEFARAGAEVVPVSGGEWRDSMEIFAGIQAHEAAALHRGHFREFEGAIAARLEWGASLDADAVGALRGRAAAFQAGMVDLFREIDFLVMPCAPVSRLVAGEDHSQARARILRYTTPISLCGLSAATLPGEMVGGAAGTGVQVAGLSAGRLLGWAGELGRRCAGPG